MGNHRTAHTPISSRWQPTLEGQYIILKPLKEIDFDSLFHVASDPLIWEQHPDFERFKIERFRRYFDSGLKSNGAFKIVDKKTGEIIGSSRYTNYSQELSSVEIGFTFLARQYWGGLYNTELKSMMLNYAFQFINTAYFVVGKNNIRSRKAMEKNAGILIDNTLGLPLDCDLANSVVYKVAKRKLFD